VTLENRREFVQLSAQYRLYTSIKDQLENLLSGFYEIIPKDLIAIVCLNILFGRQFLT
jgi:E3 ubiquitin-protein ligase HUWE1